MIRGFSRDVAGPANDQWNTNSTFIEVSLESSQGTIGQEVVFAVEQITTVVAGEEDNRLLVQAEFLEQVENAAYVPVQAGDHRSQGRTGSGLGSIVVSHIGIRLGEFTFVQFPGILRNE